MAAAWQCRVGAVLTIGEVPFRQATQSVREVSRATLAGLGRPFRPYACDNLVERLACLPPDTYRPTGGWAALRLPARLALGSSGRKAALDPPARACLGRPHTAREKAVTPTHLVTPQAATTSCHRCGKRFPSPEIGRMTMSKGMGGRRRNSYVFMCGPCSFEQKKDNTVFAISVSIIFVILVILFALIRTAVQH